MGALIDLLVGQGLSKRLARLIAYAGLVLLLLGACTGLVVAYNHHIIGQHDAKLAKTANKANDSAAAQRAKDTIQNAQHQQETHDVIAAEPDQPISPTSLALSCRRLLDAGRHSPACRRFESGNGAQARAH